jgi:heme exporter protein C
MNLPTTKNIRFTKMLANLRRIQPRILLKFANILAESLLFSLRQIHCKQALAKLTSPKYFYALLNKLFPWLISIAIVFFSYGYIGGLFLAPPDYQQGEGFRILYVHVPSAFLSLAVYSFMAANALVFLVWRIKISDILIRASAPLGAWFTVIALMSGSLWGKPMWGTFWIWDARLTSELILLFLYLGLIALQSAIRDPEQAGRAGALLIIIGFVDIPIIHYSVYWWNTLHQGASLSLFEKPKIDASMLYPLLSMILAYSFYFAAITCLRANNELLIRERHADWVKMLQKKDGKDS